MVWRVSPGRGFAASRDDLVVFLQFCSLIPPPEKNKDTPIALRIHEKWKLQLGQTKKKQFSQSNRNTKYLLLQVLAGRQKYKTTTN